MMDAPRTAAGLITRQYLRLTLREGTVLVIAALFVALVLLSAWLGWRATATVNLIFTDAAAFLQSQGKPVPANPVLETSALILLRNVAVYVSLIGVLAAIVVGNRLVAIDRRSGVLPLYGTRTGDSPAFELGKMQALAALVGGLTLITAIVAVATLLALPAITVTSGQWGQLLAFFLLSGGYLMVFGLVAMGAAARSRSETVGLLLPVTLWLVLTFVLPSVTGNLLPTASINPVSALATPPDAAFFRWTAWAIGAVSLAESYRYLSAALLDFLPAGRASASAIPPLATLLIALGAAFVWAFRALRRIDLTRSDYDV